VAGFLPFYRWTNFFNSRVEIGAKVIRLMSIARDFAKSCMVLILGRKIRARMIFRGLASGYKMHVSPAENLGYLIGTFEPCLQKAIAKYVAAGDTVYDIGANMGYVTLSLAKRVGPRGHVIAFEPVPTNFDLLQKNIAINPVSQVQALNVAASDRSGDALMRVTGNSSMASMVWHRNEASARELNIKTVAIDNLVDAGHFGAPQFVKIDVEGSEGFVLQGMVRTVATAKPVIFLECSGVGRETTWRLLRDMGYRCQLASTWKWIDRFEDYYHNEFLWLPLDVAAK
jgi:FkbM family methyltransferase